MCVSECRKNTVVARIYMQLVTMASRDQQLVPTTRTQTFYNNKYYFSIIDRNAA